MRFLSVCSGIEAASVAWAPLGWKAAALAEIEPFACAVLYHRLGASRPMFMPDPEAPGLTDRDRRKRAAAIKAVAHLPEWKPGRNLIPNFGDLTRFMEWPLEHIGPIDLVCGGTPCQAFSVAGLREGLADPRGNLSLTFLGLVDRVKPRWVVWENVPGVLSSNGGRDFGALLAGMGKLGFGWAYRVLNAQYIRVDGYARAVPQRRRRVFLVGYPGNWRAPAAVFFEPQGLLGNSPPRRETGKGAAGTLGARSSGGGGFGTDFDLSGGVVAETLLAKPNTSNDPTRETYRPMAFGGGNTSGPIEAAATLVAKGHKCDFEVETFVAHTLRGEGFDASEDGSGRGVPLVAFDCKGTQVQASIDGAMPTLRSMGHAGSHQNAGGHAAVAFAENSRAEIRLCGGDGAVSAQMTAGGGKPGQGMPCVSAGYGVRRLSPVECERLQGFPDGYTNVPWRGKNDAPDGPRYKALGNSWAINCARWAGARIAIVDEVLRELGRAA